MVKVTIPKEAFKPIEVVGEQATIIRFTKQTVYNEIYEGEGEDRHPTGEKEDSGLVSCQEEMVYGELTPEVVRQIRLSEVQAYDKSSNVDDAIYMGKHMWFDKVTRTCIAYSMQTEKADGKETTILYDNDDEPHTLPIDLALALFAQLELYAKACHNTTESHKAALKGLDTVDELLAYDITAGYPEKLVINE